MQLHDKIVDGFEEHLDIRNFVSMHNNLASLLKILLSKEQLLLFKYHHTFSITQESRKQDSLYDHSLKELKKSNEVDGTKQLKL